MERQKGKLILFLFWLIPFSLFAGNKEGIYRAYVTGKMNEWKLIMDKIGETGYSSVEELCELINYQYGYIGWCLGTGRNEEARKYLDVAERNLEVLEKDARYTSIVLTYRSAFYGYRIGLKKMLAPVLGVKSFELAREALRIDENNPFAYIQYGNIMFYVPKIFGGSKEEALKYYLRAMEIMELDMTQFRQDWNYLNLLTLISRTYTYIEDYEKSLQYLKKILIIEPDFKWVREELYPEILRKMKK